jgi:hypothetical protein
VEGTIRESRFSNQSSSTQQHSNGKLQDLTDIVSELGARLSAVERRLYGAEASTETLRSANLALNAVFDDLREALSEDDAAIDLLVEALKRSRRSNAAVRRAEERRASIIDQFHIPDFPPG